MDMKRISRMIVGIILAAASMVIIPIEVNKGDILLTISGGCFGIAGLAFIVENLKIKNEYTNNKEDLR